MRIVDIFRDGTSATVRDAVRAMEIVLVTTREMWLGATSHLLYNDPLTIDLNESDEVVDEQERVIRRLVHGHVETNPKRDLAFSLTVVSIVQDGERIGDLAKSIGVLAAEAEKPLIGPHTFPLRTVRDRITSMFDGTHEGFVHGDANAAERVMRENEQVKIEIKDFVRRLAHAQDASVNTAVILANAGLMMGRVSSHLSNIASAVVLPFEHIRGSTTDPAQA